MEPKLILINGNPGMGKTTLAQRYVDQHPLALNLDIDNIWIMMGQWQQTCPESDRLKFKYAFEIAAMHLAEGHDVIIPQTLQTARRYESFERIAAANKASLKEILLVATLDDAIERCKARARSQGHADGFRPGGVLDTGGRETMLAGMYAKITAAALGRPNIVQIESVRHDIDGTYAKLLDAVS